MGVSSSPMTRHGASAMSTTRVILPVVMSILACRQYSGAERDASVMRRGRDATKARRHGRRDKEREQYE